MLLLWGTYGALFLAVATAVALAWRRRDHRPFAVFIGWIFLAGVVRAGFDARFDLLRPLGSTPFTGVARVAFHLDQAAELSSTAGLAALAIVLCARRKALAWLPGLAWVAVVTYLATHYPEVRGDALRRVYLAAELAALAVSISSIVHFAWRREGMTPARQCLLCCVGMDICSLLVGSWRWGLWEQWALNQAAFLLLYAALTGYQGVLWLRSYPSR